MHAFGRSLKFQETTRSLRLLVRKQTDSEIKSATNNQNAISLLLIVADAVEMKLLTYEAVFPSAIMGKMAKNCAAHQTFCS
ncbi:hypothetical protein MJ391_19590 [Escherichia coli]|nr:hypothetical protein MJ391_19590 [Escherichia coli]